MSAIAERVLAVTEIDAIEIGPWKSNWSVLKDLRKASSALARLNPKPAPTTEIQGLDLYAFDRKLDGDSRKSKFVYLAEPGTTNVVTILELEPGTALLRGKVWTPHMAVSLEYQGRGIAKSLYQWALDSDVCFLSSGLQTPAANRLWQSLSQKYETRFIYVQGKDIYEVPAEVVSQYEDIRESHNLLILIGRSSAIKDVWRSASILPFESAMKTRFFQRNMSTVD
jgi:hypothetical protein